MLRNNFRILKSNLKFDFRDKFLFKESDKLKHVFLGLKKELNLGLFFYKKEALSFFLNFLYENGLGSKMGFFVEMSLNGVGFKCENKGEFLLFDLGYSHFISYYKPLGVFFFTKKGKILIFSLDKQKIGQVCYDFKLLKFPDSYKGKGIIFFGEVLPLKVGKKR